jgi:hypothetical protein
VGALIVALLLVVAGIAIASNSKSASVESVLERLQARIHNPTQNHEGIIEAIAAWTEQLRDTVSASAGLEQAILATEQRAPRAIRPHVQKLTASLRYEPFEMAVHQFANDVSHPLADFVAIALITCTQHQARDIGTLLGVLADTAREESKLQLRVWVSRARTRSAVRIIVWSVVVFVTALAVFDGAYLSPFMSMTGALMALLDAGLFFAAFIMLNKLNRVETRGRILVMS